MTRSTLRHALIVDDDQPLRLYLEQILSFNGYNCLVAENGHAALDLCKDAKPDVALVDMKMPGMSGRELLSRLQKEDDTLSVIMVTGYVDIRVATDSLKLGAYDYITKPFDPDRLIASVDNATSKTINTRKSNEYSSNLERMTSKYSAELDAKADHIRRFFMETTMALVCAVEAKDSRIEGHSKRVAEYSRLLAIVLGLDEDKVEEVYISGILHDIGKIGIPDSILQKPGSLTEEEWKIMKTHPRMSADIIPKIADYSDITSIVLSHHEWYNGRGYPYGIAGEDIPDGARILAVADTFDAMTSSRPHMEVIPLENVVTEMEKVKKSQLDPYITDAFLSMIKKGEIEIE